MGSLPTRAWSNTSGHLAVVDLGSNTFRLQVFAFTPGRPPRLVDEIRDPVRLSAGIKNGRIQSKAISRARTAARAYALFCRTVGIPRVEAVATSAIREAQNQKEILEAIGGPDGLKVTVLSTEEEAEYGYLGVINSTNLSDGGVLDVGGGSMQLSIVRDRRLEDFVSYPLGAVRATERFLTEDPPKKRQMKELTGDVAERLEQVDWVKAAGKRLFGIGGSIRTLAAMVQRRREYPLREIHGFPLTRDDLQLLIDEMAGKTARERGRIAGLKRDRADIMLGASLVIAQVMDSAKAEQIEVCSGGLREGVYYHASLGSDAVLGNVREATVRGLAEGYGADIYHADQVAMIANRIYDRFTDLELQAGDPTEKEWLWSAAMLHDTGVLIDYHDHHKHSQYLVLNAGLPGFSHRELAIISTLVRGHRKSTPSLDYFTAITDDADQERVDRLGSCLRLAEQLERGRARTISDVTVTRTNGSLVIDVVSDSDESLALWAATQEEPTIERAFGLTLSVRQA